MTKFNGRSHFEADRQKRNLYKIGIALLSTKRADYDDNEFSTILVFNYLFKPLRKPLETMLYSFAELDDFFILRFV